MKKMLVTSVLISLLTLCFTANAQETLISVDPPKQVKLAHEQWMQSAAANYSHFYVTFSGIYVKVTGDKETTESWDNFFLALYSPISQGPYWYYVIISPNKEVFGITPWRVLTQEEILKIKYNGNN